MRSSPPSSTRSAKLPRNTGPRWWPSASAPSDPSTPTPASSAARPPCPASTTSPSARASTTHYSYPSTSTTTPTPPPSPNGSSAPAAEPETSATSPSAPGWAAASSATANSSPAARYAGELGRTRIPSTDGSTAQLEQISSGTAIAARARALIAAGTPTSLATIGRTDITAGTVAAAAAAGDHVARSIFTTAATTLGIQLANLTRLVDPETVALGGGVTLAGDIFWDPLRATIEESLAQDSIPLPRLVEAELGGDAGLHGAAIALLNHYERAPAW